MTNFNFKFLGAWLVIVASITGLQAQNDSTLKGKDEMVPAGVWNDVNGEYINAHGGGNCCEEMPPASLLHQVRMPYP